MSGVECSRKVKWLSSLKRLVLTTTYFIFETNDRMYVANGRICSGNVAALRSFFKTLRALRILLALTFF